MNRRLIVSCLSILILSAAGGEALADEIHVTVLKID